MQPYLSPRSLLLEERGVEEEQGYSSWDEYLSQPMNINILDHWQENNLNLRQDLLSITTQSPAPFMAIKSRSTINQKSDKRSSTVDVLRQSGKIRNTQERDSIEQVERTGHQSVSTSPTNSSETAWYT